MASDGLDLTNLEGGAGGDPAPAPDILGMATNLEGGAVGAPAPAPSIADHPDSSRSYGAGNVRRHRSNILCGVLATVLLAAAIGIGATSLVRSNEALALAKENEEAIEANKEAMKDAGEAVQAALEQQSLNIDVGFPGLTDTQGADPTTPAETPRPTREPTSEPTPSPTTAAPTLPVPTESPTESHPLNPRWYHTDHAQFQTILEANKDQDFHPWLNAGTFCHSQDRQPCDFDAYCPNGKDSQAFHGGPPKTQGWEDRPTEQWSPLARADGSGFYWVQVGNISKEEGGNSDGNQCWEWDEFEWANGEDILTARGEEYREWVLCCEKEV